MPSTEARIETDRAGRYLAQLCRHATAIGGGTGHGHRFRAHAAGGLSRGDVQVRAECSSTHGVLSFDPVGQCAMEATETTLTLRIEAVDETGLRQLQQTLADDLARFGRRERLTVTWSEPRSGS